MTSTYNVGKSLGSDQLIDLPAPPASIPNKISAVSPGVGYPAVT